MLEKFKAMIEKNGTIDSVDVWGKRRLAYLIDDEPEGFYAVVKFTSEPAFPAELDPCVQDHRRRASHHDHQHRLSEGNLCLIP